MKKIVIASANRGKIKEIKEIICNSDIEFITMNEFFGYSPDIPESGETFLQNAKIKADWVFGQTGIWSLADDSGLEVDALNGMPGVLSARYAGEPSDSNANNKKLLAALQEIQSEARTARFRCVIVLATGDDSHIYAEGVCDGRIISDYKGTGGFGYDPLFIPAGYDKTFAELNTDVKNQISHRGIALRELGKKMECMYDK